MSTQTQPTNTEPAPAPAAAEPEKPSHPIHETPQRLVRWLNACGAVLASFMSKQLGRGLPTFQVFSGFPPNNALSFDTEGNPRPRLYTVVGGRKHEDKRLHVTAHDIKIYLNPFLATETNIMTALACAILDIFYPGTWYNDEKAAKEGKDSRRWRKPEAGSEWKASAKVLGLLDKPGPFGAGLSAKLSAAFGDMRPVISKLAGFDFPADAVKYRQDAKPPQVQNGIRCYCPLNIAPDGKPDRKNTHYQITTADANLSLFDAPQIERKTAAMHFCPVCTAQALANLSDDEKMAYRAIMAKLKVPVLRAWLTAEQIQKHKPATKDEPAPAPAPSAEIPGERLLAASNDQKPEPTKDENIEDVIITPSPTDAPPNTDAPAAETTAPAVAPEAPRTETRAERKAREKAERRAARLEAVS